MSWLRLGLIVFVVFMAFKQCQSAEVVRLGAGVQVEQAPTQTVLNNVESFQFDEYLITPLAKFELNAKVLSRESYHLDRESDLAPIDLALGWQQMSDERVLEQIDIRQSGRWYRWSVEAFPIPRRAIETQSANMHMVPANKTVATQLKRIKQGQLIALQGYLIEAKAPDGWLWRSSLSREDSGAGACELIYVTELIIQPH